MKEIFGLQKEAVKKGWGENCIKTNLVILGLLLEYIISVTIRARHVACIRDMGNAYKSYNFGRNRRRKENA